MSILATAARDVERILTNKTTGPGTDITVYDPVDGLPRAFVGWPNDVAFVVDPDTDDYVSAGIATVSLPIGALEASDLSGLPDAVADTTQTPWVVEFVNASGILAKWKVGKSDPDRTVNNLVIELEVYQ